VASSANVVVAVGGADTTGTITESEDGGATWGVQHAALAHGLNGVVFGNSTFVAYGFYYNLGWVSFFMTSTDGRTWASPPGVGGYQIQSMVFDGTKFVGLADAGVMTSTDGTSWTITTNRPNFAQALLFDGTQLVAIGPFDTYTSTDSGATWSAPQANPFSYNVTTGLATAGPTIISGAFGATAWVTGGTWEDAIVFPGGLRAGTFAFNATSVLGGRYLMVGTDGAIVYKDYP
jgi:hypothetical protein